MNNKTKKKINIIIISMFISLFILSISAKADEAPVSGKIVEIKENVTVYADKSTDSEVIVTFKAGDVMFVTGDTGDGWYTVAYQGKIGYVSKTVSSSGSESSEATANNSTGDVDTAGSSSENASNINNINNKEETHELELVDFGEQMQEEIEEEMAQTNIETTYLAEEVVQYQESKTNAIIWVVIISVMAAIIVVVGIISYRLRMKGTSLSRSKSFRRRR